jgi:ATP-dependent protease ClpP protease subunit
MNEILIYSDIGEDFFGDGVTAKLIKAELDKAEGDITVRINSYGGDVFEGVAIHNLLKGYQGKTTVIVDGIAASAASIIAMAGDEIIMAENSMMMIHDPWTMAVGSAKEMRETADLLDKIRDSLVKTYNTQTGIEEDKLRDMLAAETWLAADEAFDMKFATSVNGKSAGVPSNSHMQWIANTPKPAEDDIESTVAWRVALNRRRLALID